ncbi:MAG: Trm112 family protein [Thaumarchaeota archaeon]|nr:Trm112 family protein [Nitrososphaerota archaeon]MCZ6615836.1 Trm112 family protein [Nitrososphaerota archaeon]
MKFRLLDLLACPIDKTFPLELIVLDEKKVVGETKEVKTPVCELFCALVSKRVEEVATGEIDCNACYSKEIVSGVLVCRECSRWYPIIDEIPHMLPDELRNPREDIPFLEKNKDALPKNLIFSGKPSHL